MAVKKFGNGGVVGAVVVDGYDDVSDGDGDQGSLVRGATAIESDGLMAKDRTATYEMGLQRIRCREHVANFIFTLLLLFNIIIILTTTILLEPTQDKNKQRHLTWASPPPGQPRQRQKNKNNNKDQDKNKKNKDILLGLAHPLANPGRRGL